MKKIILKSILAFSIAIIGSTKEYMPDKIASILNSGCVLSFTEIEQADLYGIKLDVFSSEKCPTLTQFFNPFH